jgi:hypothetical protein
MSSPPGRIGTRASNAAKHPGLTNKPVSRRTSAEVAAAKKAKEAAKKAKKEAQQARLERVAEFESQAKMNEDAVDATPRPKFPPRECHFDSDAYCISDGVTEIANQSDDSDDNKSETIVPKRKKKAPAAELTTIAESSADDNLDILFSDLKARGRLRKRPILEETDSDGFGPPLLNRMSKAIPGGAAENGLENSAAAEGGDKPALKKPKLAKAPDVDDVVVKPDGHGKKKKDTVREAIEAIQKGKCFGDGPEWGKEGNRNAPDQDQIGQPADQATYVIFIIFELPSPC